MPCEPYIPIDLGEWEDWVPTWSGLVVGNGTYSVHRFRQIGPKGDLEVGFILGSTSSVSGPIQLVSPVPISTPIGIPVGHATIIDSTVNTYDGKVSVVSSTLLQLYVSGAGGTYAATTAATVGIPGTWSAGDTIALSASLGAA